VVRLAAEFDDLPARDAEPRVGVGEQEALVARVRRPEEVPAPSRADLVVRSEADRITAR
jgi:hypothetical protein